MGAICGGCCGRSEDPSEARGGSAELTDLSRRTNTPAQALDWHHVPVGSNKAPNIQKETPRAPPDVVDSSHPGSNKSFNSSSSSGLKGSFHDGRGSRGSRPSQTSGSFLSRGSRSSRVSQADLIDNVKRATLSAEKLMSFVKVPILLYPLTTKTLEDLPETIWCQLGSVDRATYPEDMLQKCIGGAIALQVKDGEPDFYPIPEVNFKPYKIVPADEVREHNATLYSFMQSYFGCEVVEHRLPCVVAGFKDEQVLMVRLSDLDGEYVDACASLEVEAPWGGTQAVAGGHDAFVAIRKENSEISEAYIVQEDHSKNPAQYIPAT